jgi:hypothetical protein
MKMRNTRARGFPGFVGFYGVTGLIQVTGCNKPGLILLVSPGLFLEKKTDPMNRKSQRNNSLYP